MNIIGNSCTSSYMVRDLFHEQFNNPFVWCSVSETDILYTINNYETINWLKFKTNLYSNDTFKIKCVEIIVDNRIKIKYPHYCLSNTNTKISGINVFSKDILDWATNKYTTRTNRMFLSGKPFYILGGSWNDQVISQSFKKAYNSRRDILILEANNIQHDNYKLAVHNFKRAKEMTTAFYSKPEQ